ncbi:hypothetical protein YPPY94_2097, partial [Yersinia pestis PY-94]
MKKTGLALVLATILLG